MLKPLGIFTFFYIRYFQAYHCIDLLFSPVFDMVFHQARPGTVLCVRLPRLPPSSSRQNEHERKERKSDTGDTGGGGGGGRVRPWTMVDHGAIAMDHCHGGLNANHHRLTTMARRGAWRMAHGATPERKERGKRGKRTNNRVSEVGGATLRESSLICMKDRSER